jgi:hypothetical protein
VSGGDPSDAVGMGGAGGIRGTRAEGMREEKMLGVLGRRSSSVEGF